MVIGRNEGARLEASLRSVQSAKLRLVFVDSGSVDDSCDIARKLGVPVVELDPARPFTAGRGRNEGLDEAFRRWPDIDYVLFLDGDCTLDPQFPVHTARTFKERPDCAIVIGHLTERHPDKSIYNRLCSIEWRSPAGVVTNMDNLGGIMAARVSSFLSVGGFQLQAIAGEEPDLGRRLMTAGGTVIKIDAPMATHDADITRFAQWWKRAVRGGHALAYRFSQHGRTNVREGRRELISDFFWGFALPMAIVVLLWPTDGWSLLLLAAYPLFGWRVYSHYRSDGLDSSDALLAARFIIYGKFAHVVGIATYCRNWLRGEFRIIEYK